VETNIYYLIKIRFRLFDQKFLDLIIFFCKSLERTANQLIQKVLGENSFVSIISLIKILKLQSSEKINRFLKQLVQKKKEKELRSLKIVFIKTPISLNFLIRNFVGKRFLFHCMLFLWILYLVKHKRLVWKYFDFDTIFFESNKKLSSSKTKQKCLNHYQIKKAF